MLNISAMGSSEVNGNTAACTFRSVISFDGRKENIQLPEAAWYLGKRKGTASKLQRVS